MKKIILVVVFILPLLLAGEKSFGQVSNVTNVVTNEAADRLKGFFKKKKKATSADSTKTPHLPPPQQQMSHQQLLVQLPTRQALPPRQHLQAIRIMILYRVSK